MKNAIVFGGSGFIGSHVADILTEKGYNVYIFDKNKSKHIKKNQKMIIGDILDDDLINSSISNMDIVYNFAGISDIEECHSNPIDTINYNILGNANIIKSSINNNVKRFLFASSAYVYSSAGSFYRISKQASEQIVESYFTNSKINYTILRYGSLYGERSNKKNYIYNLLYSALKYDKIDFYGNGDEIREFIHVRDAAELSVKVLDRKNKSEILMLTGSNSIKYIDLLDMINEILMGKIKITIFPKKTGVARYKMTPYSFNPKMAKKLMINPHIELGQGILNIINNIHEDISFQKS